MILEIVGARLIAPYFGTSSYVWTAMIGAILGSLSLGFWYGGRLADRYKSRQDLSVILTLAAGMVLLMFLVQELLLKTLSRQQLDLRLSSALAAILLFGFPSMLMGMVSPYLAKIRITSLRTSGSAIGRLEAAGAVGSIAGTFLCGYFLLAYIGARDITLWLVVTLTMTSFVASPERYFGQRLTLIITVLIIMLVPTTEGTVISDQDSAYSRYQVQRVAYKGRTAHFLRTDNAGIQSAVFVDDPTEPVFDYIRKLRESVPAYGEAKKVLIIGGGAHTLPTILHADDPLLEIHVVEIDPALDAISRQYFAYQDESSIHLHYQDGRSFLNNTNESYDLIFMDAFNSLTPPFHLTSLEAVARLRANLKDGGAIIVNVVGSQATSFLSAIQSTYSTQFPFVSVYQTNTDTPLTSRQNLLLVATADWTTKQRLEPVFGKAVEGIRPGLVLTDDYAPIERLSY